MLYVDTSAFVSVLVREGRSARVIDFIEGRAGAVGVSPWVLTEAHSALSMKVRSGGLSAIESAVARDRLVKVAAAYHCEAVVEEDFSVASEFVVRSRVGLRAADALHLAICKRLNAELLTFDMQMKAAAAESSIVVVELKA